MKFEIKVYATDRNGKTDDPTILDLVPRVGEHIQLKGFKAKVVRVLHLPPLGVDVYAEHDPEWD